MKHFVTLFLEVLYHYGYIFIITIMIIYFITIIFLPL